MVYRTSFQSVYICDFCGNQSVARGSCPGCGGSSFRQEVAETHTYLSDDKHHTGDNEVESRWILIAAILSIIVVCVFVYSKTKGLDENHVASNETVTAKSTFLGKDTTGILEDIPEKGYRVFYYHVGTGKYIHQDTVSDISLNLRSNSYFHGIRSYNLAALWVGKLHIQKKGLFDVFTNNTDAEVQLRLDGTTIPLGTTTKRTTIELDAGEHIVEAGYKNRNNKAEFDLFIRSHSIEYSTAGIVNKLPDLDSEDYKVLYVYQRRTPSGARSTLLHLGETSGPVVLVLDSYNAIDWKILNTFSVDLRAIVIGSYKGGSSAHGQNLPEILTLRRKNNNPHMSTGVLNCNCSMGCRSSGLVGLVEELEALGTGNLSGITTGHSNGSLAVPEIAITSAENAQESIEQMRRLESCPGANGSTSKKQKFPGTLARTKATFRIDD